MERRSFFRAIDLRQQRRQRTHVREKYGRTRLCIEQHPLARVVVLWR
jgi:hypothetical protein